MITCLHLCVYWPSFLTFILTVSFCPAIPILSNVDSICSNFSPVLGCLINFKRNIVQDPDWSSMLSDLVILLKLSTEGGISERFPLSYLFLDRPSVLCSEKQRTIVLQFAGFTNQLPFSYFHTDAETLWAMVCSYLYFEIHILSSSFANSVFGCPSYSVLLYID